MMEEEEAEESPPLSPSSVIEGTEEEEVTPPLSVSPSTVRVTEAAQDGELLTFIIVSQKLSGTGEYHVDRTYEDFDWLQQHLFSLEDVPGIQGIIVSASRSADCCLPSPPGQGPAERSGEAGPTARSAGHGGDLDAVLPGSGGVPSAGGGPLPPEQNPTPGDLPHQPRASRSSEGEERSLQPPQPGRGGHQEGRPHQGCGRLLQN
ncbi:unnamed protein product [Arctogadus glacialis]